MATSDEIKALRGRLKETQAQFASRFDVNQSTLNRWEKYGLPTRGTARIAVEKVLQDLVSRPAE